MCQGPENIETTQRLDVSYTPQSQQLLHMALGHLPLEQGKTQRRKTLNLRDLSNHMQQGPLVEVGETTWLAQGDTKTFHNQLASKLSHTVLQLQVTLFLRGGARQPQTKEVLLGRECIDQKQGQSGNKPSRD